MSLVGKERGMNFTLPLQAHKKTVIMLFQLINAADARRAQRSIHGSRCVPHFDDVCLSTMKNIGHSKVPPKFKQGLDGLAIPVLTLPFVGKRAARAGFIPG
jgi:hypothetical protein